MSCSIRLRRRRWKALASRPCFSGCTRSSPSPAVAGDVRHRLCTEIQRRFVAEGIVIPFPTHELHLNRAPASLTRALLHARSDDTVHQQPRFDSPGRIPPTPHSAVPTDQKADARYHLD